MVRTRQRAARVKTQEPMVKHPKIVGSADRKIWPEDKPLPRFHVKQELKPCPKCRRVLMDDLAQAVICIASRGDVAFFRCKQCGNSWSLPVQKV